MARLMPHFLGHGHNFLQKKNEVLAQLGRVDARVSVQRLLKLRQREALFAARQAGNDVALEQQLLVRDVADARAENAWSDIVTLALEVC